MGCVYAYTILLTFLGPEFKGRSMAAAKDEDLAEATGRNGEHIAPLAEKRQGSNSNSDDDIERVS